MAGLHFKMGKIPELHLGGQIIYFQISTYVFSFIHAKLCALGVILFQTIDVHSGTLLSLLHFFSFYLFVMTCD